MKATHRCYTALIPVTLKSLPFGLPRARVTDWLEEIYGLELPNYLLTRPVGLLHIVKKSKMARIFAQSFVATRVFSASKHLDELGTAIEVAEQIQRELDVVLPFRVSRIPRLTVETPLLFEVTASPAKTPDIWDTPALLITAAQYGAKHTPKTKKEKYG